MKIMGKKKFKGNHPANHPIVIRYQEMVRDAIEEIKSDYIDKKMPQSKKRQVEKLEKNIEEAPYWLQNVLPLSYRQEKVEKEPSKKQTKKKTNKKVKSTKY